VEASDEYKAMRKLEMKLKNVEEMIKVMKSIKQDTNSLDSQVMKMGDGKIKREVDGTGFGLDN
jgi:hypothetical protein